MAQEIAVTNAGNKWLVDIIQQQLQNSNGQPGWKRFKGWLVTATSKVTLHNIEDCYDSAAHNPGYYGPSVYHSWCRLGGSKDGYYAMLRDNGFKKLYEQYKSKQEQKALKNKGKKKRPKQQKSNTRIINQSQHQKTKPKKPALFTDIYAEAWEKFEEFATDMPKVSAKSIKKYLNKAPDANATLSKDMKSLLAVSYMVVYFSDYHNSITVPAVRYYGGIFFVDFDESHPFGNDRGSYGLVKDNDVDEEPEDSLILAGEWKVLFEVWIGWNKNKIHKRIKQRVELQIKANEEVNKNEASEASEANEELNKGEASEASDIEQSENISDIVHKNVGENKQDDESKQKDVDDEIESGHKEANIGDIDSGIKQMCNDLGIVLNGQAKKALSREKVSLDELKECHIDGSLKEYMEEPLFLNAIQRRRIMKYMET
eukprot:420544_1